MKGLRRRYLIVGLLIATVLGPCPSNAQYTADFQTNIISGVASNWSGDYLVGSNWVYDALLINGGGALSNGNSYVGYEAGADNNGVVVSDPGSVWSNNGSVYIGNSGTGNELAIINGGMVVNNWGHIGANASAAANIVLVSGNGSVWSNANDLYIGESGSSGNVLIIDGGGFVANHFALIGFESNSNSNRVLVSDAGSVWNSMYGVQVGGLNNTCGNSLVITNGGVVNSTPSSTSRIGAVGTLNTAVVTGTGSVWNTGTMEIGAPGTGNSLVIRDGAVVASGSGVIGSGLYAASNSVTVDGSASVWNENGTLYVGYESKVGGNILTVTNGGLVVDDNGFIGQNDAGANCVMVSGTNSVWRNQAYLYVGHSVHYVTTKGDSLVINGGGKVFDQVGYIGYAGTSNRVVISGAGSTWSNSGPLYVGSSYELAGHSSLVISNGGSAIDDRGIIAGYAQGSTSNNVVVTGTGSAWKNYGDLYVGTDDSYGYASGGDSLTINQGGMVFDTNSWIGNPLAQAGVNSILVSDAGSVWSNAGTVTLGFGNGQTNSLAIRNGGVVSALRVLVEPNNTIFLDSGNLITTRGLTIFTNATLSGIGTIVGRTTIGAGGTLAPGDGLGGPGSITFSTNLTLAAGSTFAVTLNGPCPGQYDQIMDLGTISISNSVLSVSLGYTPLVGDSFTIISNLTSMAVLGTFVNTAGAALPNGADFVVDNITFQIDYTANYNGLDVVLTAVIPEPSSLLLTALGAVTLWAFVKRKRA